MSTKRSLDIGDPTFNSRISSTWRGFGPPSFSAVRTVFPLEIFKFPIIWTETGMAHPLNCSTIPPRWMHPPNECTTIVCWHRVGGTAPGGGVPHPQFAGVLAEYRVFPR